MSCALSENASVDCKDTAYQIVIAVIENKHFLPADVDLNVQRLLNTVKRELSTKNAPTGTLQCRVHILQPIYCNKQCK